MRRLVEWIRRHELGLLLTVLCMIALVVYLAPNIFIFIGPGERGVLWRRFAGGVDVHTVYQEGVNVIFPWNMMTIYDTREQIYNGTFDALSNDGLTIQMELGIRYRADRRRLGYLQEEIGSDYLDVVLLPEVGAAVRAVIARYSPEKLYTADRLLVQGAVVELARRETGARYVEIDDIRIRSVILPAAVREAIERKLSEQQHALQYKYVLAREVQEAERKRIEAAGIRDFQQLVSNGISEQYLKWKGIDATLELARSNNAKVVIIGSNANGLPIILNTDGTAAPSGKAGVVGPAPLAAPPSPAGKNAVPPVKRPPARPAIAPAVPSVLPPPS